MAVKEAARTARAGAKRTDAGGGAGAGAAEGAGSTLAAGRAAQELELKRGEFDLAVHLELISTDAPPGGGRPRVRRQEVDRLQAMAGFPESLRDRVRTAGTAEGAALLGISGVRFSGLARIGCISPVAFYLNRYRAVVWLYLVDELAGFGAKEPELLAGKSPVGMRTMLESGVDWRARNWRARRIDRLLSRTEDPWARAAVQASALDAVQLAEVVDDPYERAYLARVRPEPAFGRPGSVSGRETMGQLMLADDPDEILWRRVNLVMELDRARERRSAPRPGGESGGAPVPVPLRAREAVDQVPGRAAVPAVAGPGLLARIGLGRRRSRDH